MQLADTEIRLGPLSIFIGNNNPVRQTLAQTAAERGSAQKFKQFLGVILVEIRGIIKDSELFAKLEFILAVRLQQLHIRN